MKRSISVDSGIVSGDDKRLKRIKSEVGDEQHKEAKAKEENTDCHGEGLGFVNFDENLLYEIFKHVDSKSLGVASCVSKLWNQTAQDERLWEMICTRGATQVGYDPRQFRSVVLTLGGFRRLHSLYLWPLIKPPPPPVSAPAPSHSMSLPPPRLASAFSVKPTPRTTRWGKDEVHLSLGLLSIRYFEKMQMNFTANGK